MIGDLLVRYYLIDYLLILMKHSIDFSKVRIEFLFYLTIS